jgi:hypothetical protein
LFVQLGDKSSGDCAQWLLESGATDHMTHERPVFLDIDTRVQDTLCFGDGSVAKIKGRGTILLKCKAGEHKALQGVYLILRLTANITSLNQL